MRTLRNQQGLSILSVLTIAIMVGFFVMCFLKMGPAYLEYLTVKDVVSKIAKDPETPAEPLSSIRRQLSTSFNTNQVKALKPKDVEVKREDGMLIINANYEARVNILKKIDAVMIFDDLTYSMESERN